MGCGVSKFDLEEVAGPTCEFKIVQERKNNHRAYSPLATKPSLEDGQKEDIDVEANHGRKSFSMTIKEKLFVKETNVQDRNAKRVGSGEKERGFGREKETRNEEVAAANVVASGDNEEGEEDGQSDDEERREDSILYPGSPSFREYCVYDDGNKAGTGSGAESEKESQKEGFLNSDKGSRTQSAKSGRKGRGIRNYVLNMGGSSGLKK